MLDLWEEEEGVEVMVGLGMSLFACTCGRDKVKRKRGGCSRRALEGQDVCLQHVQQQIRYLRFWRAWKDQLGGKRVGTVLVRSA